MFSVSLLSLCLLSTILLPPQKIIKIRTKEIEKRRNNDVEMDALTKRPTEFEDKLRSAHEKLRKDHVDLLYKVQQVEKENEELQELLSNQTSQDQQVRELHEQILSLEASISPMKERNEQLEDEVHKLQNEKITLDLNIKQMNCKAQQRQNQHERFMEEKGDEVVKLTNELNRLKESLQHITAELNDQRGTNDANETPKLLAKKIIIPDLSTPPPYTEENIESLGTVPKVFDRSLVSLSPFLSNEVYFYVFCILLT